MNEPSFPTTQLQAQELRARNPCRCKLSAHQPRSIVLTGGPGAGKTAVLQLVLRNFCEHVVVLPEAAGILFRGGLPRLESQHSRQATQLAIFHVQRALEEMAWVDLSPAILLCDRGTLDGIAYWPDAAASFFERARTTEKAEIARYDAVIHLRTPSDEGGYNRADPVRSESAEEAARIDERIVSAWCAHPQVIEIGSEDDFLEKAAHALSAIATFLPRCCARHRVPEVKGPPTEERTVRDPVCGMDLAPEKAAETRSVAGDTYYFCSASCASRFDSDTERYTGIEGQPSEHS